MDYYIIISLALFPILTILFFINFSTKLGKSKLPPGPKPWPIIGNIHMLGDRPHRSVAELVKVYGPIMSLKLGTVTTIVVSSPETAKEMFLDHDLALSGRSIPDSVTVSDHDKISMVWLPVGAKWRNLRKISTIQLFTSQRLDASQAIRQKKLNELVDHARHCCDSGVPVDIGKAGFITSLNLLSNTFFSKDLASYDSSHSQEFKDVVWEVMVAVGSPNMSDFFPVLKHLDLQGIRKRMTGYFRKLLGIFEKIIQERLKDSTDEGSKDDVLGSLLKLVKADELTLDDVKHLLLDLFVAGTDTTSNNLEWAMTELLRNPEKMVKAQQELDKVVGKRSVQESDISNLPYIQAVVKETFRLHPGGPFLVPHKAEKDVELCGYLVPKGTQVWINVWSIGRDPKVWPDSLSFSPERFLNSEVDIKGRDFELLAFGTGRRMCPGMPLAYRMVHLTLATLIHSFSWKHAYGLSPEEIDMEEKFGITLQKVQPLLAIPLAR